MKTLQEISQELKKHFTEGVNVYNNSDYGYAWKFFESHSGFIGDDYFSIYLMHSIYQEPIIEIAHVTDEPKVWIDIIKSIEPEIPVKYYEKTFTEKTV